MDGTNQNVPPMFENVLCYLQQQADSSGMWPTVPIKQQLGMLTTHTTTNKR